MKVVTAVVNNPRFIELQYYTLARYMKCDYEFIVFNDAKAWPDFTNGGDASVRAQIEEICRKYGIRCINIPNAAHQTVRCAMQRCADANNYILQYQLANPDKYLCIDSDMFLIDDFDPARYDGRTAVVLQTRGSTNYFWNGIYYFDIEKMPKKPLLNWTPRPETDVGGSMMQWLSLVSGGKYPSTDDLRWTASDFNTDALYWIRHLWSLSWNASELPTGLQGRAHLRTFLDADPRNSADGKYFAEIYDGAFLHYRAGGNWRGEGMALHADLSERLFTALMNDF
jgi:hypothetical protein